jgi:fatty-acyl-CoA synthase
VLVGIRKGEQTEAPAVVVVPCDGRKPSLDEINQHLLDRGTTSWYLPERLELIDRLDRDSLGKVDKHGLREWLDANGP